MTSRFLTVAVAVALLSAGGTAGVVLLRDDRERSRRADITVLPSRDTYVSEAKPDDSYGDARQLRADGRPTRVRSYLHFDLPAHHPPLFGIRLRLYANAPDRTGLLISPVAGRSWTERTTWRTAPPVAAPIARATSVEAGGWVDIDISVLLHQSLVDGLDLALLGTGDTMVSYSSRENGGTTAPRLVLRTDPVWVRGERGVPEAGR